MKQDLSSETRKIEVAVISDVHLGTYASKAKELLGYLKSIKTEILVINGDFIIENKLVLSASGKKNMDISWRCV